MPPPEEHITVKSGVSLRYARPTLVHVSLLAPENTDYTACHPKKKNHVYITRCAYHSHTHVRLESTGKRNKKNKRQNKTKKKSQPEYASVPPYTTQDNTPPNFSSTRQHVLFVFSLVDQSWTITFCGGESFQRTSCMTADAQHPRRPKHTTHDGRPSQATTACKHGHPIT